MRRWLLLAITLLLPLPAFAADNGIISKQSRYSVPETIDRLESIVKAKGLTVFARIDHSGEAGKAGLKMRPTQLLIFGSPKAGTPMMKASPTLGIDLPLKALAWQDQTDKVWLSYNSAAYLGRRHHLKAADVKTLAAAAKLFDAAVK